MIPNLDTNEYFQGHFGVPLSVFKEKCLKIKAFIFDWDGVFNNGRKGASHGSDFSEVDSMAINMMRFGYYLATGKMPYTAIITGEENPNAKYWGEREHLHNLYFKAANKMQAFEHFLEKHKLKPEECLFIFDDILDLSVASKCGLRFMVGRKQNPLLNVFVEKHELFDYQSPFNGNQYAIREFGELYLHQLGNFEMVIQARMKFAGAYREYLRIRQSVQTEYQNLAVDFSKGK